MKPKLLVIPHIFAEDIKIRDIEFSRCLTDYFKVYCLRWKDMLHVNDPSSHRRRIKQLRAGLASLVRRLCVNEGHDGLIYVDVPFLQTLLLQKLLGIRSALRITRSFNTAVLNYLVRRLDIGFILMASGNSYFPTEFRVRKFYDIVDWFPEDSVPLQILQETRNYLTYLASDADGVFAVSDALAEKLSMEYGLRTIALPNGADLNLLRHVPLEYVKSIRNQWGLSGKFVIGYIGNHGPFTGIDFILEVFKALHLQMEDACLFIVGPMDFWKDKIVCDGVRDVVFTGPVPPSEISAYFRAIDVGVVVVEKSPGTDFSFRLKAVEYTACRKPVVATPLLTLDTIKVSSVPSPHDHSAKGRCLCHVMKR